MAGNEQAAENAVGHSTLAAPAARQKRSAWTGVRFRQWGRWATEIRVPHTYMKVWIGVFDTEREAALAYDAVIFCFYGENPPSPRKFNFPAAPRPVIPENVRVQLTVDDIKDIAKKHTRGLQLGPLPAPTSSIEDPVQVAVGAAAAAASILYHGHNPNPMDIDLNLDIAANGNLDATADMLFPFASEEELAADAVVAHAGNF